MTRVLVVASVALTLDSFLQPHLRAMRDRGWQVSIASDGATGSQAAALADLGAHDLASGRSVRDPAALARDARVIRRLSRGMDLVVTHTPIASALVRFAAPRTVPVAYVVHGLHVHPDASALQRGAVGGVERWLAGRTALFLTMNEHDATWLRRWVPPRVVEVHGVGVDVDGVQRRAAAGAVRPDDLGARVVAVVGELNANKSVDVAIRAFAAARRRGCVQRLDVIGDGPQRAELERLAGSLGVGGDVAFHGWVDDVPERLGAVDILVSASRREGLPVSIIEAQAVGVAVVGRDIRGVRDLLEGGRGVLVQSGTNEVGRYADALCLLSQDEQRQQHVDRALAAVGRYEREAVVAQHLDAFERLLSRGVSRG